MLRHAQIHNVIGQMPKKKRQCHVYKRKRYTTIFLIKFFSKKKGWARRAHASAKRLPPFFGKNSIKKLLCIVCVCKKWHCRFFEAFDLSHYQSVRVWAFLVCKKIEIRVMWTFTASKKENPCSFLRVRSSAEKLHSFSEVFLSCGNIKHLLKAIQLIIGYPYHTKIVKNY